MDGPTIVVGLAGVLATAAPIVVAAIGETFAERSGVINLSVNGSILLSAMGSFAVAVTTGSLVLGFITGAAIGAAVALIVAFGSITLRQSQVAIGFVLTLFCRDLSYFLGNPFMGEKGPRLAVHPIPGLEKIPILGTLLFEHDVMTYFSFVLIVVAWWWIFRTRPGLTLRAVGERPAAAFARGAQVNVLRYTYTILGGALVGLAGPMYSLSVKAGWKGTISGLDGLGWIVLAIVIFGAWNPVRVALGAYLFGLLQWLSVVLQPGLQGIPSQVLQVAPFPLMILTLLLVNIGNAEWVERVLAALPERSRRVVARVLRSMRVVQPRSLGIPFERD
jgi:general nucleoside transport system permease protein